MAQALGRCLHGEEFRSLSGSAPLDLLMRNLDRLPRRPREWFYAIAGVTEAIGPRAARRLDVDAIAAWLAGLYPDRAYPAAFVGSSNGAVVHLAAALGVPFLPQTFLCPVRRLGADPDDAQAGLAAGRGIATALARARPDLAVHQMQDPNQDRLMLQTMSYFRLKHRRLPAPWRDALARWLPRGATLYVVDCRLRWPVTRLCERALFQFGAAGGATLDEYFHGGERVRAHFRRYGVDR
ncbi:MAG TPA: hypothetical protein VG308_09500, partial [Stellaceae bacterium]|nr:hypothetical protein [Stellaceae bacterium]